MSENIDAKNCMHVPEAMPDILPHNYPYFTYIKKVVRHRARQAGFKRISTPVLENKQTIIYALGADNQMLNDEIYNIIDKEGNELSLKMDGTIGLIRSYLENKMNKLPKPITLFYIEPNFRFEKPASRTFRQFWQFGFEVIGQSDSSLDAQIIQIAHRIHKDLGIADKLSLQINSIGSPKALKEYKQALDDYYAGKERSLCKECNNNLHGNILSLTTCKEEDCKILSELAPKLDMFIDDESKEYHKEVLEYLDELNIPYVQNNTLTRDLSYYCNTVFEFWNKKMKSSTAVAGGGRYNDLIEKMGGESTPAVGYAAGMERLIAVMKNAKIKPPYKDDIQVFVAQLGHVAKKKCLKLLVDLRNSGVKAMGALGKGSINKQLDLAESFNVKYTVLIGITEVREGTAIIRNMEKGSQITVSINDVKDEIIKLIGKNNLDTYSPGELVY